MVVGTKDTNMETFTQVSLTLGRHTATEFILGNNRKRFTMESGQEGLDMGTGCGKMRKGTLILVSGRMAKL